MDISASNPLNINTNNLSELFLTMSKPPPPPTSIGIANSQYKNSQSPLMPPPLPPFGKSENNFGSSTSYTENNSFGKLFE